MNNFAVMNNFTVLIYYVVFGAPRDRASLTFGVSPGVFDKVCQF